MIILTHYRDGVLFRYILDYLRNGSLILPENFQVNIKYQFIFLLLIYLTPFRNWIDLELRPNILSWRI